MKLMYLCLFIAGFSGMMLELIGTRVIAPFYGTTLFTWAALITITLVFLSIGYFVGGIIAKQEQRKKAFFQGQKYQMVFE
jgi:predicted membrane-bound spermidine synthase